MLTVYLARAIDRARIYNKRRGLTRDVKSAEAELKLLDELASSDRALLIFVFQTLFAIVIFGSVAMAMPLLLSFLANSTDKVSPEPLVGFLLWFAVSIGGVIGLSSITKAKSHKESKERLEAQITDLKARLEKVEKE